jgi:hypothetical protein
LSPHRSPDPSRPSRRLAVCGGLTAALLVVPGIAHAEGPAAPTDPLTGVSGQMGATVQDLATSVTGGDLEGGAGQLGTVLPGAGAGAGNGGSGSGTDGGTGSGTETGPAAAAAPELDPAQLTALLAGLGVSADCAPAIQEDLQLTLASIPATVQQVVTELGDNLSKLQADPANGAALLQDALTELTGGAAAAPGAPTGVPLVDALQQLVTDFVTVCLPEPEAGTTPPPVAPVAPVVQQSSPVPAAAPETAAAPVAYLGYAPTGAPADSGSGAPLLALGGALLLSGGGTATWMRSRRAASSRG